MAVQTINTVVEQITSLVPTEHTKMFRLTFPPHTTFDFQPGQFVMAQIPRDGKIVKKPYSIASPPHEQGYIELCLNRVPGGYVSNYFCDLKGRETIPITGPYGKFVLKEPHQETIFVATGTGIAPFRSMISHLLIAQKVAVPMWLIFGVRYETDVLYEQEWRDLEKRFANFHFIPTVSRPETWTGEKGYVQTKVEAFIKGTKGKNVYACGLPKMIEDLEATLLKMGFTKDQLHYEKYV